VHHCWASYFSLHQAIHIICNAHIIRELQALIESGSKWAETMQEYLLNLFENSQHQAVAQELLPKYVHAFHQICQQGFLDNSLQ